MPIDVDEPRSPGWWIHRLAHKLKDRQRRLNSLIDRFEGNAPLPSGAESAREAYQAFQRKARTNYAELVVESARERMTPTGFLTAAEDDEAGDREARRIWEANGLDVEVADVIQMMLAAGDGYMMVGGVDDDVGAPVITGEDPRQVVTIHDPARPRVVRGGLKMFHDPEEERDYAFLFLPGRRWVALRDVRRRSADTAVRFTPRAWDWDESRGGAAGQPIPGPPPIVRFRNRGHGDVGVGEFEPHTDLMDRINFMLLQRMVIATFQAFKQMAIKGLPDEDEDGREIDWAEVFTRDPGAIWKIPEGVEFWESGQVDLTPILLSVKDDVRDLAAVTRTPLSYLMPDAASQSAEGAALMREGHVFKVEDRIVRASEALKDVMSLAFLRMGDRERADRSQLRVLWAPPERRSLAERADAAQKAQDVPWRTRMQSIWGFTATEVDEMEAERAADTFLNMLEEDRGVAAGSPASA